MNHVHKPFAKFLTSCESQVAIPYSKQAIYVVDGNSVLLIL